MTPKSSSIYAKSLPQRNCHNSVLEGSGSLQYNRITSWLYYLLARPQRLLKWRQEGLVFTTHDDFNRIVLKISVWKLREHLSYIGSFGRANYCDASRYFLHFPPTVTEYQYNCWKLAQSFLYIVACKHSIIRQEINTFFLDSNQNPALVITPINRWIAQSIAFIK